MECVTPGRADGAADRVDRVDWLDGAEVKVPPGAPSWLTALQPRAPAGLIAGSA